MRARGSPGGCTPTDRLQLVTLMHAAGSAARRCCAGVYQRPAHPTPALLSGCPAARPALPPPSPAATGSTRDVQKPFWAAQQRFFKLLCVSMKVGAVVREARAALDAGYAGAPGGARPGGVGDGHAVPARMWAGGRSARTPAGMPCCMPAPGPVGRTPASLSSPKPPPRPPARPTTHACRSGDRAAVHGRGGGRLAGPAAGRRVRLGQHHAPAAHPLCGGALPHHQGCGRGAVP